MSIEEKLDDICRKIVHIRDEGKPCIICNMGAMSRYDEVAHYFKRRHLGTRWNLNNLALAHTFCNQDEERNPELTSFHARNLAFRLDKDQFNELIRLKHSIIKMSISDKKELLESLKNQYKQLIQVL